MSRGADTRVVRKLRCAVYTRKSSEDGLNRPGFLRGFFVQNLRGFFKGIHLCVERLLHFLWRAMPDGAV